MRFAAIPLVFSLLSASHRVLAGGIIDNTAIATILKSAATSLTGTFYIQNVATGDFLAFRRPDSTTNVNTESTEATVTLGQSSATGKSGTLSGTFSGTYISGMEKCLSSQFKLIFVVYRWGNEDGAGVDVAGVSYACVVGDSITGTSTLEVAKQFWLIVPVSSSSSSFNEDDDDGEDDSDTGATVAVVLAAAARTSSSATSTITSSASSSSSTASVWTPQTTQSVIVSDRSTWVCKHPGKWLYRHQDYVTSAGHVECADDLAAHKASLTKRMVKRGHGELVRKMREKRASKVKYSIIAVDHITDMKTRALGSSVVSTVGGYSSQGMVDYDSTDDSQLWYIYS